MSALALAIIRTQLNRNVCCVMSGPKRAKVEEPTTWLPLPRGVVGWVLAGRGGWKPAEKVWTLEKVSLKDWDEWFV